MSIMRQIMEVDMKLYKVLDNNGEPCHGGSGAWFLPYGERPGKWMPKIEGELRPCKNGYHMCREGDLVSWLGKNIYEAEYSGELIAGANKVVVRKTRLIRHFKTWNETTARLFAADCAERVLFIFEREYSNDPRPRQAIEAARAFARGEIGQNERRTAQAAARAAAQDAEKKWQTTRLFEYLNGEVK